MIYLLLFAGLFMGWSLGTNDAANAFGTAVATRGVKAVHFGVFKNIAIAWVSSPTVAGLLAYAVAFCTRSYFGA